ncbi:MAG: haloalkane dehalogenase [Brevundimonas sp.]
MRILRTPDSCFEGLEGYDFAPHYTEIADADGTPIRIHHIDEGPRDGPPVLLMHGNPTWAYLYRKMIPVLAAAGCRVMAVDLVGCGRSDKPSEKHDYTLARHYDWIARWLAALDLKGLTLFCQDWGGTIGLAQVANTPERFDRVIACNTGVPAGEGGNEMLRNWLAMMAVLPEFPFDGVMQGGMTVPLTPAMMAAYKAPFPEPAYQAGIVAFPQLIAIFEDNPGVPLNREIREKLKRFDKPFLTVWGGKDMVTPGGDRRLQREIPGTAGQAHLHLPEAGHFLQEDAPDEAVQAILSFMGR